MLKVFCDCAVMWTDSAKAMLDKTAGAFAKKNQACKHQTVLTVTVFHHHILAIKKQ